MSFFIRKKGLKPGMGSGKPARKGFNKKRPQNGDADDVGTKKRSKKGMRDIEISSDSDEDNKEVKHTMEVTDSEEEETAQEKNLRLAKKYLSQIKEQEMSKAESDKIDKAAIAHRLREDILEQTGRLKRLVADTYAGPDLAASKFMRCKELRLPVTCLVVSPDDKFAYTGSKGCEIIKWSLQDYKRVKSTLGAKDRASKLKDSPSKTPTHCLAISADGKFLVSGDQAGLVHVWDPDTLSHTHAFKGHRAAVTGLAFRKGSHQLFSGSADRSVKVWSLDEMGYVETLFGHTDVITGIDALTRERCITSGGRDCSVRVWKIAEESQLVYNGHRGSIDAVKLVSEDNFLTCGDDGTVSLWSLGKKKPLGSAYEAHGKDPSGNQPHWISSIATLVNTDLVASGSQDGQVRVWKCGEHFRKLLPVFSFPASGFANAMSFTSDGSCLVVGLGQEHRRGRWWRIKEAKNGVMVMPLLKKEEQKAQ